MSQKLHCCLPLAFHCPWVINSCHKASKNRKQEGSAFDIEKFDRPESSISQYVVEHYWWYESNLFLQYFFLF